MDIALAIWVFGAFWTWVYTTRADIIEQMIIYGKLKPEHVRGSIMFGFLVACVWWLVLPLKGVDYLISRYCDKKNEQRAAELNDILRQGGLDREKTRIEEA